MKIGIVGLGRMGAAMSQRMRQNGHDVVAWDRNAASAQPLASAGVKIVANARAVAAETDVIISIITADGGVRRIFNGQIGRAHV